jgi:glutamate--cysteine ligase
MSSLSNVAELPITDRRELVEYLASGSRPRTDWRIGTEHEKFGFRTDDLRPPTFDGERGIEALLEGLVRFGWTPVKEHGRTIALAATARASRSNPPASSNSPAASWRRSTTRVARPTRT